MSFCSDSRCRLNDKIRTGLAVYLSFFSLFLTMWEAWELRSLCKLGMGNRQTDRQTDSDRIPNFLHLQIQYIGNSVLNYWRRIWEHLLCLLIIYVYRVKSALWTRGCILCSFDADVKLFWQIVQSIQAGDHRGGHRHLQIGSMLDIDLIPDLTRTFPKVEGSKHRPVNPTFFLKQKLSRRPVGSKVEV